MALAASTSTANETITLAAGSHTGHVLVSHTGCTVNGAGPGRTIVALDATYAEGVRGAASVADFTLKNLTLDCGGLAGVTVPLEIVVGAIASMTVENVEIRGHARGTIAIYNRGAFHGTSLQIIGDGGGINHFTGATATTIRGCRMLGGLYGFVNTAAVGIDIDGLDWQGDYWQSPRYEAVTATGYGATYADVASHVSGDRSIYDVLRCLSVVTTFDAETTLRSSSVQEFDRVEMADGTWTRVLGVGPGNQVMLDEWRRSGSWRPASQPSGTATVYRITLGMLFTSTSTRLKIQTDSLVPESPRWRAVTGETAPTPSAGNGSRLDIIRVAGSNIDTDTGGVHITEHAVGAVIRNSTVRGGRSDLITLRGTGTVAENCIADLGGDMCFTVDGTNDRVTVRSCTGKRAGRRAFYVDGGPSDLYSCAAYDNGTVNDGSDDYAVTTQPGCEGSTLQIRGRSSSGAQATWGLLGGVITDVSPGGFSYSNKIAAARRRRDKWGYWR